MTWHKVISKSSKKYHFLLESNTLCNIDKSHLNLKPRKFNDDKKCKVCLSVLNSFNDMSNFINHSSNSNNLRSNNNIEFEFIRHHEYNPLPPIK